MGKNVSAAIRAYTAGFIDADGAIMATIERHNEARYNFRVRVTVKITQGNKVVLDWFESVYGFGRVVPNRSAYDWLIRGRNDTAKILKLTKPYLRTKSEQAQLALEILSTRPDSESDLIRIAQMADSLSKLNVRSKNRRTNYTAMIQEICLP